MTLEEDVRITLEQLKKAGEEARRDPQVAIEQLRRIGYLEPDSMELTPKYKAATEPFPKVDS